MSQHPRVDTVAMTAAFLAIGLIESTDYDLALAKYREGGQIEMVDALTNYAPLIATVFDNETRDFIGVFHYEVTEAFGDWFIKSLAATGELPDSLVGIKKIGEFVEAFFSQGGNHG